MMFFLNFHLHLATLVMMLSTTLTAQVGTALDFDGVNDKILTTNPTVVDNIAASDLTIEIWIKPEMAGLSRIVSLQKDATHYISLSLTPSYEVEGIIIAGAVTATKRTSAALLPDEWVHLALVWHASPDTFELYFNGMLQTTVAGSPSATTGTDAFGIGSVPLSGPEYFGGEIDDVRVWAEARTACEILGFMSSQLTGTETNLVRYFPINEGTAEGENGTVTNLDDWCTAGTATLMNFLLDPGTVSNYINTGTSVGTVAVTGAFQSSEYDTICYNNDYTFPDGAVFTTITSPMVHYSVFPGIAVGGCDSVIKTNLTLWPTWNVVNSDNICIGDDYTFSDGITYSGITADTSHQSFYLTTKGCDSVVTTDIFLTIPDFTVNVVGSTLSAYEPGATWQWLDCNSGMSPIPGATGPEYDPADTGSFAVIVTLDGCPDTSECVDVTEVNGFAGSTPMRFSVYPNPNNGAFALNFPLYKGGPLKGDVYDYCGRKLTELNLLPGEFQTVDLASGSYMMFFRDDFHIHRVTFEIQR